MKDTVKLLNALSLEGFKAAKGIAHAKGVQIPVHETADGLYFITDYTGYFCWDTNNYNFYGASSPYKITSFPYNLDNSPYVLHYVETVIKGKDTYIKLAFNDDTEKLVYLNNKAIPKALKSVITDRYTKFYAAKMESTALIFIYNDPYVLAYVMPTKIMGGGTK